MEPTMTYEEMVNYIISLCELDTPPTEKQQETVSMCLAKVRTNMDYVKSHTLQQLQSAVKQLSWRLNDWNANKPLPINNNNEEYGVGVMFGNTKKVIL